MRVGMLSIYFWTPTLLLLLLLLLLGRCERVECGEEEKGDVRDEESGGLWIDFFGDATKSEAHVYDLKDSEGLGMDCVHVDYIRNESVSADYLDGDMYIGLYHHSVDKEFQIRLASSKDLVNWTYRRTLLKNADMPFLYRVQNSTWMFLTHEQWMRPNSQKPSQLGFKLWYSEYHLVSGEPPFNSFVAPLTLGAKSQWEGTPNVYSANMSASGSELEGTPTIYSANMSKDENSGLFVVNADVGFHFNDDDGKDQVATAKLLRFGPTTLTPVYKDAKEAVAYNDLFIDKGAVGNIGQRAPGFLSVPITVKERDGDAVLQHLSLQEANVGMMPPTIWADWRVWIYQFDATEGLVPRGLGTVEMIDVKTHGNSTAVGNPSWHKVPCPSFSDNESYAKEEWCVFISYFLFGEGAAPGEAGVLSFVKTLTPSTSLGRRDDHGRPVSSSFPPITVSGVSAGAFFAVQMHVAYSSRIFGAGAVAGGPFYCALGELGVAETACMRSPDLIDIDALVQFTKNAAAIESIDSVTNLKDARVYLFSGSNDTVVHRGVVSKLQDFYGHFVTEPSNIAAEWDIPAEHCFPTIKYGNTCAFKGEPYINDCAYDAAGDLLTWLLTTASNATLLRPAEASIAESLHRFNQSDFLPFGTTLEELSLAPEGYVYVPRACATTQTCPLHVTFHGCLQSYLTIDDQYVQHTGYNELAETNGFVVLYPQTKATALNPKGCFDWWGYTGQNYASKLGLQMRAVWNMIEAHAPLVVGS